MGGKRTVKPSWKEKVDTINGELKRISVMFEMLKQNSLDEELKEGARQLEPRTYALGKRYVSLGNALYPVEKR